MRKTLISILLAVVMSVAFATEYKIMSANDVDKSYAEAFVGKFDADEVVVVVDYERIFYKKDGVCYNDTDTVITQDEYDEAIKYYTRKCPKTYKISN